MGTPTKVFLCTDTLVKHRNYYVVTKSRVQAEEDAPNIPSPAYLEDGDDHQEYADTVVNEEVATIFLVRKDALAVDPPQILRLIPTDTESESAYQGYLVEGDTAEVSLQKRVYLKAEWQLYQQSER
jgi:hypothetical protein